MRSVDDCRLIELPKVADHRGNLTFIEESKHVPFDIARVFYVYDIPSGESRGAHAHKELQEFIICVSGGFDVHLDDGRTKRTVHLNRPWRGLYVPSMIWLSEAEFDPGTVYLVLASTPYDESDYIRDYDDFVARSQAAAKAAGGQP